MVRQGLTFLQCVFTGPSSYSRGFVLGNTRKEGRQSRVGSQIMESFLDLTNEFGLNPDCSRAPLENFKQGILNMIFFSTF